MPQVEVLVWVPPEADLETRIQAQMVYLWGVEVGWRVAGLGRGSGKLIRGMLSD